MSIYDIGSIMESQNRLFNDNFRYVGNGTWLLWYQLFYIIAFFVCIIIASIVATYRYKVKYDLVIWYVILMIPCSFFGAHFWSACIGDINWSDFLKFRKGGMAIQGGVVFAVITAMIYFPLMLRNPKWHVRVSQENDIERVEKPSILIFFDIICPLVLLGQAIGRWGNFFNGELFGQPVAESDLYWLRNIMPGVFDRMQAVDAGEGFASNSGLVDGQFYQPLFLYEGVLNILCFMILYFWVVNYKEVKIGTIGMSYFWVYGLIRFSMEPLRNIQFRFTATYILNGLLLAAGIIGVIYTQFLGPKYRNKQIIYMIWIKYIRLFFIKIGIKFKFKWALKYELLDKNLKNYGFEKPYDFDRNKHNPIYYGGR